MSSVILLILFSYSNSGVEKSKTKKNTADKMYESNYLPIS